MADERGTATVQWIHLRIPRMVWFQVPSTPSMLLYLRDKFVLYLSCERNGSNQKEAWFCQFKKITDDKPKSAWGRNQLLWHLCHYNFLLKCEFFLLSVTFTFYCSVELRMY